MVLNSATKVMRVWSSPVEGFANSVRDAGLKRAHKYCESGSACAA